MHRNAQALIVTDLLAHHNCIAFFHQALAGCADVLGQGDHKKIRLRELLDLLLAGIPLIILGMDATKEFS